MSARVLCGTIVYSSRTYRQAGRSYQQLMTIRLPGARRSLISSTPRHHNQPLYSPNLRAFAFTSGAGADTQGEELWVHDVKSAREELLFRSPDGNDIGLVVWSHDAASLYLVVDTNVSHICRFDIAQRKMMTLAAGCQAAIAPDGVRLAYTTCEGNATDGMCWIPPAGNPVLWEKAPRFPGRRTAPRSRWTVV